MDIFVIVNKAKDHPIKTTLAVVGIFVAIFFGRYSWLNYKEAHTPCIDIESPIFFFQAGDKPWLNVTGIIIDVVNQSNAWAKNVEIDFINDDGYSKYEKLKYYKDNNLIEEPRSISPKGGKITNGWLPQGPAASPTIYKNKDKEYNVDIFIDWESDKGTKYSLVARYVSIVDNLNNEVRFRKLYRYDTFSNKKKVKEIKEANRQYLPLEMM